MLFLDKLLIIFGSLAGNGRAWMLNLDPIRTIIKSLLSITEELRNTANRLPSQAYPWLCDDEAIPFFEKDFSIDVDFNDSIDARRSACVMAYLATGCQSLEYLEYMLKKAGFEVSITENLDGADLTSIWSESFLKLANGVVYWLETSGAFTARDPINKPDSTVKWKKCFLVDVSLDVSQFEVFKKEMLKYKPAHTVAIVRDTTTEKYDLDANLVSISVPADYDLDSNLVSISVPADYDLDANLFFV